jgi:hypothetical protein
MEVWEEKQPEPIGLSMYEVVLAKLAPIEELKVYKILYTRFIPGLSVTRLPGF